MIMLKASCYVARISVTMAIAYIVEVYDQTIHVLEILNAWQSSPWQLGENAYIFCAALIQRFTQVVAAP